MKIKLNKLKLLKRSVIVILCGVSIGFFILNSFVKNYGFNSIVELINNYRINSNLAKNSQVSLLQLNLSVESYKFLELSRQVALDRGIQINEGDKYVECEIECLDNKIDSKIRLKGHMTDHLEGDKWSFRVKSKDTILGMHRFSLQHPGTRNYVYEWVYHQLLKQEGIINLKYDFISLRLNKKDLGIYAIEEHFGQHVLERNNRPKGAIIRWNPNLYWEGRIDGYHKIFINQSYSSYMSAFAEPYDKSTVLEDQEILDNYQIAATQLELFRKGDLKTTQVFDVEKMARFHAIIDLVGGHHSLDWSDVKLYYNSETRKIEPIGYESFSIRESHKLAGQMNPSSYDQNRFDYHEQLFSDPSFYKAYIRNLERIANEEYVHDFYTNIKEEFNEKIGIIAKEWPYRIFNFDGYFKNVKLIKHNLKLPKPFHAFVQSHSKDSVFISLAPVSDFPIEILGLKKKNKIYKLKKEYYLSPKVNQNVLKYFDLKFPGNFLNVQELVVLARIPGSVHMFEVELAEYPSYKRNHNNEVLSDIELNIDTNFVSINDSILRFINNKTKLSSKMIVPYGYQLIISPDQKLILEEELIVLGTLNMQGLQDFPILFNTVGSGICSIYGDLISSNAVFSGRNCITSKHASLLFNKCLFYDVNGVFITNNESNVVMTECSSGNVRNIAVNYDSNISLINCFFTNGDVLMKNYGSNVGVSSIQVSDFKTIASLNYQSNFVARQSVFENMDTVFVMNNSSTVKLFGSGLDSFDIGFIINPNYKHLAGKSTYTMYSTLTENFNRINCSL